MFKGVIFDIGGVIIHDIKEHLFYDKNEGLFYKYKIDKTVGKQIEKNIWEQYAYRVVGNEKNWTEIENKYWKDIIKGLKLPLKTAALIKLADKHTHDVKNILPLIKKLKTLKYDLLICSNNTEFWFQRANYKYKLTSFFNQNNIILSHRVGESKSNPNQKMFKAVEQKLKYKKENYLFIDDKQANVEAALEYGFLATLFPYASDYGSTYIKKLLNLI